MFNFEESEYTHNKASEEQNTKANFWIKLHPPTTKAMIIPMISFYPIQLVNVSATLYSFMHTTKSFSRKCTIILSIPFMF